MNPLTASAVFLLEKTILLLVRNRAKKSLQEEKTMAYVFNTKPVAVITAKQVGEKDLTIPGVTNASTTADNAVTQINKILTVAGRTISANGMTRTQVEEAVEQ